ncbi:MAG TPA: hypothetical protein VN496_02940 [Burkholderiales bacterium]|nr:hypothetical protein [Burkholderiales bacterium]
MPRIISRTGDQRSDNLSLPLSDRTQRRFVIFAQPKEYGDHPNSYYSRTGQQTTVRAQAAQFASEMEAENFALSMGIKLTIMTYVGEERFAQSELENPPKTNRSFRRRKVDSRDSLARRD